LNLLDDIKYVLNSKGKAISWRDVIQILVDKDASRFL
jgi:hypothetical protein